MINLDKINSQLDINNFDPAEIPKLIVEHQKIVKMVFLIGSILIVWGMFNDHHAKDHALRARMAQEQGKLAVIKSRDAAVKDLNDYKSSLPSEMTELQLILRISNLANLEHVTVASLNPADSKDMGLYNVINVSFSASSDNFKDMMLFLRKLEKSDPPIRVNSWSGKEDEDGKITFDIGIGVVTIHP